MDVPSQQARYQVRLYDTNGTLVAIFDDWRTLNIVRNLNGYDLVTFSIDGNDSRTALFTLDAIIEIWRHVMLPGQDWYRECTAMHRTPQQQLTETDTAIFTSYSRGLNDLLRRRSIGYYANTAYTLKSGPGETVIKEFVDENAGPSANSVDRKADGTTLGLTIEPDSGAGTVWSGARSWQNLLEVIQEISIYSSVDFEIVRQGYSGQDFLFRTGYPQLGTDRSATVNFSPTLGNMMVPSYTLSRTEEITRAIVLGQGQENNRKVVVVESGDINDSPWNTIETTADARNQSTLAGLTDVGNVQLTKSTKQESFQFEVLQTATYQYGKDYFLGDLVQAGFLTVSNTIKIVSVEMSVSQGRETVKITFSTLPAI